ncbi:hypothetical protein Tco_0365443 [Tanacetum coccineum]
MNSSLSYSGMHGIGAMHNLLPFQQLKSCFLFIAPFKLNLLLGELGHSQSSSRHSTLGVDRIGHQFLGEDNGSSPLIYSVPGDAEQSSTAHAMTALGASPTNPLPIIASNYQVLPALSSHSFKNHWVNSTTPSVAREVLRFAIHEILSRALSSNASDHHEIPFQRMSIVPIPSEVTCSSRPALTHWINHSFELGI